MTSYEQSNNGYSNKYLSQIALYEAKLNKYIKSYEKILYLIIDVWHTILNGILLRLKSCLNSLADSLSKLGKISRKLTFPLHWLDIWFELWRLQKLTSIHDLPIFEVGAHYFYGKPGAGKSTGTYHAMMQYAYYTGKFALTTEPMEMPRKNLNGTEYYYHSVFKPSELFQDGIQVASIPERYNVIVYEEMLTKYNQRNNKSSSYNDEVIPMIAAMGTQRHQGIDLFYFLSQLPITDVQIMLMLAGYHKIKVKKGLDYAYWLDTGKIRFNIKGWKIKSYTIEPKSRNDYRIKLNKRYFYPNTLPGDMEYFNRLNMKETFAKMPKLKLEGLTQ